MTGHHFHFEFANMTALTELRVSYSRADRCWRSNNLRACLQICDDLTQNLIHNRFQEQIENELAQLKDLVWFLKMKCLSEDYYINESLLLNEDDVESEDQVRTFTATARQSVTRSTTARANTSRALDETGLRKMTSGSRMETRGPHQRTGMLTGRMPTRTQSRQTGGRATSSYRPLTTSLTATQTAFSRSTRPLLKYSTCGFLCKPIYEYLYNAQRVTNKCPDYRQCLEYLNLVPSSRKQQAQERLSSSQFKPRPKKRPDGTHQQLVLLSDDDSLKDQQGLGAFWCVSFGICYFNLKMNKQAEDYFRLALKSRPKSLDPYLWLIKVYLRQNQPQTVLKICEDGLSNTRNAILFNWKARVQSLLNDTYSAHVSLRESLRFYPTNIEALANVGHYSFYSDKLELSLKCFERINQLSLNTGCCGSVNSTNDNLLGANSSSAAELFNNLALSNFYCGNYTKVMPLFQRAFLNSPNGEVTSNIWYNISFIPLSFGSRQLAISCLMLALRNNSQNEEAINNLGCLKWDSLVNDPLHYGNRQEYWSGQSSSRSSGAKALRELQNGNEPDQRRQKALFDEAETFFKAPSQPVASPKDELHEEFVWPGLDAKPEMLFNMAVLKRRRGQLLASIRYCKMYLEYDQNNHSMRSILEEIRELVSHDN